MIYTKFPQFLSYFDVEATVKNIANLFIETMCIDIRTSFFYKVVVDTTL